MILLWLEFKDKENPFYWNMVDLLPADFHILYRLVLLQLCATENDLDSRLVHWSDGWEKTAARTHIIKFFHPDKQLTNDYLKPVVSQLLQVDDDELLQLVVFLSFFAVLFSNSLNLSRVFSKVSCVH
jgi:hypothetical protein